MHGRGFSSRVKCGLSPVPLPQIMPFAALSTKEVKHVSADHMMVRHSVPETIFQAWQQEALEQEQELGFASKPRCS